MLAAIYPNADTISSLRKEHEIETNQIADLSGLSTVSVSQIELGQPTSLKEIRAIAKALNTKPGELILGAVSASKDMIILDLFFPTDLYSRDQSTLKRSIEAIKELESNSKFVCVRKYVPGEDPEFDSNQNCFVVMVEVPISAANALTELLPLIGELSDLGLSKAKIHEHVGDGSVTIHINGIKQGIESCAEYLARRYFKHMVDFANRKLKGGKTFIDGEDIANHVLMKFFQGIEEKKFENLDDRNSLMRLLLTMVARNVIDVARKQSSIKAGGNKVKNEASLGGKSDEDAFQMDYLCGETPIPGLVVMMEELFEIALKSQNEEKQLVFQKHMDGMSNSEIAKEIGRSERYVELALKAIRDRFKIELEKD